MDHFGPAMNASMIFLLTPFSIGLLTIAMICDLVGSRQCQESPFCIGFHVVGAAARGSQKSMRAP